MSNLASTEIALCKAGSPPLSSAEVEKLLLDLPNWTKLTDSGTVKLTKQFELKNFKAALAFTNDIGSLAELASHHPSITTEWGKVTVTWWTHTIKGLHLNDFIMAARVEALKQIQSDIL